MSITNYSELIAKVAGYAARSGLQAEIADSIALFEASYNAGEKSYFQEVATTLTTTSGIELLTLPTDFYGMVDLSWQNHRSDLTAMSLDDLRSRGGNVQGSPTAFAMYPGNKVVLSPVPDGTYVFELIYKQKVPPLTDASPQNWLLTRWPHVYVYGTLMFMLEYVQDGPRADAIKTQYRTFMQDIQNMSWNNKLPASFSSQTATGMP